MNLKISSTLSLPIDAALWTFADLAIKGAGKTYVASVLAEELIKRGVPIVAIDSMGIWWGLRVGVDEHDGLPVVVFGGKHKDLPIPANLEKGREVIDEPRLKLMVKAILESKMSAVIDTSDLSKGMRRRVVAIFVNELNRLNQDYGARHVFLEEADEWVPQRLRGKDEWANQCFGAVDDLVRKSGNFLLGCTLISQRSAVVSKDVLSQINCLIVLRILYKGDKEAVQGWVESVARPDDPRINKWYDSLRKLKNGEAWIWKPEEPEIFERIQFRERETLHATREYFTRAKFEQKDIRMMDVGEFVSKFKNVFEPKRDVKPPQIAPVVAVPRERESPQSIPVFQNKPEPQKVIQHTEKPIQKSLEPIVPANGEEIHLEEKQLVIKVSHSEKVQSLTTETQKGQVIFVLMEDFKDASASSSEILTAMQERGWNMSANSFSPSVAAWVKEGLIVREGSTTATRYRLPKFVRFDVRKEPILA